MFIIITFSVEPLVSGHPQDQGKVSAYERCPPTGGWKKISLEVYNAPEQVF